MTGPDRVALVRSYVLLALGAIGALRIYFIGIGAEPLTVGLVAACLGLTLIPGRLSK